MVTVSEPSNPLDFKISSTKTVGLLAKIPTESPGSYVIPEPSSDNSI